MEKGYNRVCNHCGSTVTHKQKSHANEAIRKNRTCKNCPKKTPEIHSRNCPSCEVVLTYSKKSSKDSAEKMGRQCNSCANKRITDRSLERECPKCEKIVTHKTFNGKLAAIRDNRECRECSKETKSNTMTLPPFTTKEIMTNLLCVEWKSVEEIATIFGKTKNQVNRCIMDLNISRDNFKQELHKEGKSYCSKCFETKVITQFRHKKNGVGGISRSCIKCEQLVGNEWYKKNKEITIKRGKQYRLENPENYRKSARETALRFRTKFPHIVRMRNILKRFISKTNSKKNQTTEEMLGYTFEEFKNHIDTFELSIDGNHIDHICPLSWFNDQVPINIANSLDNLQILSVYNNESKSAFFSHPIKKGFFNVIFDYLLENKRDRFVLVGDYYVDKYSPFYNEEYTINSFGS